MALLEILTLESTSLVFMPVVISGLLLILKGTFSVDNALRSPKLRYGREKGNDCLKLFKGLVCRLGIKFNPWAPQREELNPVAGNFREQISAHSKKGLLSLRASQRKGGCLWK